jgi:hypothetical protein
MNVTETCKELLLQQIRYTTLQKAIPIYILAIKHNAYQFALENGCYGAAEFLKLWSY